MFRGYQNWRRLATPLMAAALLLCLSTGTFAQGEKPVSVQLSPQKEYTRVVLGYDRLTAYRARAKDGGVTVTLDSLAPLKLPKGQEYVGALSSSVADGITTLRLSTTPGATFKDYRVGKKIVVDIYPAKGAKVEAPKPVEKPPVQKAETAPVELKPEEKTATPPAPETVKAETPKVELPRVEPPKTEDPPPASTPAQPNEPSVKDIEKSLAQKMPAVPAPSVIVDVAPPETTAAVAPQPPPEPTVISISTVEPVRLAVFTRFDTLWVVMDTEAAGAMPPGVSGPEAGLLGNGKLVKLSGGTAYRYTRPPGGMFISAERDKLQWRVRLTRSPAQSPATANLNVVFDDTSGHARLMAELKDAGKVMELHDPSVGDTLSIVATGDQGARIEQSRRFTELEIIPAAIGMVARPLSEKVKFTRIENFVLVTSPGGLTATPGASAGPSAVAAERESPRDESRLFDFPNWRQGGLTQLYKNARELEGKVAAAEKPEDRGALLMKLALLYFANNFGHEALGVLRIVQDETPDMVKNPNFVALRGAASAMAGHYADAIKDLSFPAIQHHGEVNLWIGYAAAATEQWKMANRSFPPDNYLLLQYPENIAIPFTIYMAESALRLGKRDTALSLLASLDTMQEGFGKHYSAAVSYLKGEAARQNGNVDEAIKLWRPVAIGLDRLYHTKATLALANLRVNEKLIPLKQAIEDVDNLRFAWRGDGLEVQILQNLGLLKIKDGKYLSGLEDLKTAAQLADNLLDDSEPIRRNMSDTFADLFVHNKAKDLPPLEAVSIYNGFSNLMPDGEAGAAAALNFADSLVSMDLLEKAATLLQDQLRGGYVPQARVPATETKLAAVYLLDGQPEKAISILDAATRDVTPAMQDERLLLRARALSQMNKTQDAIAALSQAQSRDALKLKADVLWRARRWGEAAAAIEALLPPQSKQLAEEDAQMVVNAAVAYKLATDAKGVSDLRARFGSAMESTSLGSTFGVVTRSGGRSRLSDRDTILRIAGEVDMFKGFLDTYKAKGS